MRLREKGKGAWPKDWQSAKYDRIEIYVKRCDNGIVVKLTK